VLMTLKSLVVSLVALGVLASVASHAATPDPRAVAAVAADRDHDGLPDRWERRHHVRAAKGDPDHDGLSNRREFHLRTNPHRADTDGDGFRDRAEVRAHSNPRSARSVPRRRPLHCNADADPGSFGDKLGSLHAGQTLCLAAGDYGTFSGAHAPDRVTIGARPGTAATMEVNFNGAHDITLDGLTIDGAHLLDATRNITIRNSRFTDFTTINGVRDANILLDHNTHLNMDTGPGTPPARVHLSYGCDHPSGVTVRDSLFAGGDADGIQAGCGVNIIHNVFRDIQYRGSNHTDAIQLVGAGGSVVRGNYFKNTYTGIVAYDGVEHALIEDNALDVDDRGAAIELYSDDGSVVRHNTLRFYGGHCWYNEPCGQIAIDRKPQDDAGHGTVVDDNIATDITVNNGSSIAVRRNNLLHRGARGGDRRGSPRFTGGSDPPSFAGFRLKPGSPGRGAASDGRDVGIG
jgi:Bacterial TSP3 repeat